MRSHLHRTLLRLAGWLPDDLLADARARLVDDQFAEIARMLAFAGQRTVLPLTAADLTLLADLLVEHPDVLDRLELVVPDTPPTWQFVETPPETGGDHDGQPPTVDDLVAAVSDEPAARGAWLAWRLPGNGSPYPPPTAVHIVEADDGDLAALTGRLQRRLATARGGVPLIEVVAVGEEPPAYQAMARECGTLLWARAPERDIAVARVFDTVDPHTGPGFAPDHPRLTDERERDRILHYLDSGTVLLATTSTLTDSLDPTRGAVVPMSFRTDGAWIWTDTIAYYLREHQLAPEPQLLRHIQEADGPPPDLDAVTVHRAMRVLTQPSDTDPVRSG
jgi:hypothetical protein